MATLIDSYSESNFNNTLGMNSVGYTYCGQSFMPTSDTILDSCKFYLATSSGLGGIGYVTARLYSHSGTYGSTGTPNTLLATSDNFNASSILTVSLCTFTFSGAQRYSMVANTPYFITVYYNEAIGPDSIEFATDASSPTHAGNFTYYSDSFHYDASNDGIFYIYGEGGEQVTGPFPTSRLDLL